MARRLKIGVLLLACMGVAQADSAGVRPATKAEIESMRDALQGRLKDADSAKFKDVVVIDGATVCGLVNSKNSYGAYPGFTTFSGGVLHIPNKPPMGLVVGIDENGENTVAGVCANKIAAAGGH